jgi:hypothetical protein
MVNFTCQYDPKDFIDKNQINDGDATFSKKIDSFFDVVAP